MVAYRAYVAAGLSLMAVACAIQQLTQTPSAPPSRGVKPTSTQSVAKVERPAVGVAPSELDLSAFRPVLAEPAHSGAKALLDEGDGAAAARQLWPPGSEVTTPDEAALAFTAGGLYERAGLKSEAEKAWVEAAQIDWPLRFDAALRAAEVSIESGQLDTARALLLQASSLSGEHRYERARAKLESSSGKVGAGLEAFATLCAKSCPLEDELDFAELAIRAKVAGNVPELSDVLPRLVRGLRLERARRTRGTPEYQKIDAFLLKVGAEPASTSERIADLKVMVEASRGEESLKEATALVELRPRPSLSMAERCELDLLYAKSLALNRKWGAATDALLPRVEACVDEKELHVALLFNLAKFAAADGRDPLAIQKYAELERRYPQSSLADDARLRAARCQKELGNLARFTELLSKMPEDYPQGDMTMEGVLELALHSAERNDWGAASLVLERGATLVRGKDSARGTERSGAERYFWARALYELDQTDKALSEYEAIVREVPLSYYMLHAYSRLHRIAPERAQAALEAGQRAAEEAPFTFAHSGNYQRPAFRRGLELLRAGELEEGRRVLEDMGLQADEQDSMLWGMALLFDRAGDAQAGHQILRGRLTDWLAHYPSGPWRAAWEVGFPRPYYEIVRKESVSSSVPESLIYGVMREESTFDPKAESPARAFGLMQIIESTARMVGKPLGLKPTAAALLQPKLNIQLGARVLAELLKMFRENPSLAIPGYNAGPGRPRRWLSERPSVDFDLWVELIPIRETRRYMKRVLASRAAYACLYGTGPFGASLLLPEQLTSASQDKTATADFGQ
jgi:soluble lytic murein transglycosylase